jgi:hypothetical protein
MLLAIRSLPAFPICKILRGFGVPIPIFPIGVIISLSDELFTPETVLNCRSLALVASAEYVFDVILLRVSVL